MNQPAFTFGSSFRAMFVMLLGALTAIVVVVLASILAPFFCKASPCVFSAAFDSGRLSYCRGHWRYNCRPISRTTDYRKRSWPYHLDAVDLERAAMVHTPFAWTCRFEYQRRRQ